jgi:hypothetical protein
MAALPVQEQTVLHVLKAFTDGEIGEAPIPAASLVGAVASPVYTDPEDITFGNKEPTRAKRRPKIYAVVWTWRKHRIVKTKKRGTEVLKVWKRWYERQGWKVTSCPSGYFAANAKGDRHAISLDEYDKETKERL